MLSEEATLSWDWKEKEMEGGVGKNILRKGSRSGMVPR